MKKIILFSILFVFSFSLTAQNEANHWYFGDGAGLDFSNGDPVADTSGAINTIEGCAVTSDSNGNLLFYTDGNTVYSSNHTIMQNGQGLHGDSSSSQSAIIVPKPSSPDRFYIFTVDDNSTNEYGLQYSEVDMNLDGGLGGIIVKNTPLLNLSSEKITAVKSDLCSSLWVISFSSINGDTKNYNTFHSFEVTSAGVNPISIKSTFNTLTEDARGYLKVSADATKIAIAHTAMILGGTNQRGVVRIYDFDYTNGQVSNQVNVPLSDSSNSSNSTDTEPYGIEFSLSTSKLYITSIRRGNTFNQSPQDGYLWQYNLATSSTKLISYNGGDTYRGALQMGPNGKIYRALSKHYSLGSNFLGVINSPEALGTACDYQHNAINLGSGTSRQGLPPFIQSLFLPDIDIINNDPSGVSTQLDLCDGETYRLEVVDTSAYPSTTTYNWIVDGIPVSPPVTTSYLDLDDNNYSSGFYELIIEFNNGDICEVKGEGQVDYHPYPVTNPITIKQCDTDTDGFSDIDLTVFNSAISTDSDNETFTYYTNQADANAGTNMISAADTVNYNTNSTGVNPLWVRIETPFCHTVERVDIIISATNTTYNETLYKCDDYINGISDETDGFTAFDLTIVENNVKNQFPVAIQPNLEVDFYLTVNDALLQNNGITDPVNYRNITDTSVTPERIFIRVNNNSNLDCQALGVNLYVDLIVEEVPIANQLAETIFNVCDNGTGKALFDTSGIESEVVGLQTGVSISYYDENSVRIPNNIFTPSYLSTSQTITIRVSSNSSNDPDGACNSETAVELKVNEIPVANPVIIDELCDDMPDQTDGMSIFNTIPIKAGIIGTQTNIGMRYFYADGTEILPTLPNDFNSGDQTITVEVFNLDNPLCVATTTLVFEIIDDYPIFEIQNEFILCADQLPLFVPIENPADVYHYVWTNHRDEQIPTNLETDIAEITDGGIYTVTAISTTSICTVTQTFNVIESSFPIIETVTIFDDLPNNRVSVLVTGQGDYQFSLDDEEFVDGNELDGHIFYNVLEGGHTIHVKDLYGCEPQIDKDIVVVRFPKYLSPNHDGVSDTFNVIGGEAFAKTSILIFDRYGKVIAKIENNEPWNGIYREKVAPETDYWYLANFVDHQGKTYERRGHFSLKL